MRDIEEYQTVTTPTLSDVSLCNSHEQTNAIPIKKKKQIKNINSFELHNVYISPSRRKTNVCKTMEPITCQELVLCLRTEPMSVLVLDCRDKEQYDVGHVLSALNVPQFEQDITPPQLEKLFTSYEEQIFFRQREFSRVVLYDQYEEQEPDERLDTIFEMLRQEALTSQVFYLKGGFVEFAYTCPVYCSMDEEDTLDDFESVSSTPVIKQKQHIPSPSLVHTMTTQERLKIAHARLFSSFTRTLDCELPTMILDHVYLGSAQNAFNRKQLSNLQVRYIINTAKECDNHYPDHFLYMKCPMIDDETEDATRFFDETFDYIENARSVNSKILIHCFMGMSRSATIVIAYLMKFKRWNLKAAYRFVRERRPIIELNVGFMYQLVEYEKSLHGSSSLGKIPFSPAKCK